MKHLNEYIEGYDYKLIQIHRDQITCYEMRIRELDSMKKLSPAGIDEIESRIGRAKGE